MPDHCSFVLLAKFLYNLKKINRQQLDLKTFNVNITFLKCYFNILYVWGRSFSSSSVTLVLLTATVIHELHEEIGGNAKINSNKSEVK